jgi:hypothetical protein
MAYKIKNLAGKRQHSDHHIKMALQKHVEREGHPRYAWFFGEDHEWLVSKMTAKEREKLKAYDNSIKHSVEMTYVGVAGLAGGYGISRYFVGSPVIPPQIGTPVTLFGGFESITSQKRVKEDLKARREYLKQMNKKYQGGK